MSRFDCPSCNRSLRFRILPHVPRNDGQLAFSCVHCGTVLGQAKVHTPLGNLLIGTRLRSLLTYVASFTLLSIIANTFGRTVPIAVLTVAAVIMLAVHLLSPRPAYTTLSPEQQPGGS